MKVFLSLIILIELLISPTEYSQTVKLGEIEISIGDSLSEVLSKIDTNYYSLQLSEVENMEQTGAVIRKNHSATENNHISLLGFITFFISDFHQPTITSIEKFWAMGESNAVTAMNKFYSLLDNYGIDKYEEKIEYEKDVEPDGTLYTIVIRTNSWRSIILKFDDYGIELREYVTENNHQFDDKLYYLFFDDYKHYTNKKTNIIIEKFDDEKNAEKRQRELWTPYLVRGNELPKSEIIRVWSSGFDEN